MARRHTRRLPAAAALFLLVLAVAVAALAFSPAAAAFAGPGAVGQERELLRADQPSRLAEVCGQLMESQIASGAAAEVLDRMERGLTGGGPRPGLRCGFVFRVQVDLYPKVQMVTHFTDDADVDWEIGHDLRPLKLESREW